MCAKRSDFVYPNKQFCCGKSVEAMHKEGGCPSFEMTPGHKWRFSPPGSSTFYVCVCEKEGKGEVFMS